MRFVVALFVREILVLISWIFVALVVQMLALWPMNVAGLSLEGLVLSLGGRLVVPVVALEGAIPVPVVALVGATLLKGTTMQVAMLVVAIVALPNGESYRYSASPSRGGVHASHETRSASLASS